MPSTTFIFTNVNFGSVQVQTRIGNNAAPEQNPVGPSFTLANNQSQPVGADNMLYWRRWADIDTGWSPYTTQAAFGGTVPINI